MNLEFMLIKFDDMGELVLWVFIEN